MRRDEANFLIVMGIILSAGIILASSSIVLTDYRVASASLGSIIVLGAIFVLFYKALNR